MVTEIPVNGKTISLIQDCPVWVSLNMTFKKKDTTEWGLKLYGYAINSCDWEYMFIAFPTQPKPDKDYRP